MMTGTFNSSQVLIFALLIIVIIGINYLIFAMLRNKKGSSEMSALMKTTRSLRQPFAKEDRDLNTLSKLISELKTKQENEEES
jgi:hypothetical protein